MAPAIHMVPAMPGRRPGRCRRARTPHKFSQTICLEIVGVAELILGFVSIIIESVSLRFPCPYPRYAPGISSGIVSVICGCITICLALRNVTRWVFMTCLLHLLALIAVVGAITCVIREEANLANTPNNATTEELPRTFIEWKIRMVLTMSEVQFVVSVLLTIYLLIANLKRHLSRRAMHFNNRHRRSRERDLLDIDFVPLQPPTYSSLFLQEAPPPYQQASPTSPPPASLAPPPLPPHSAPLPSLPAPPINEGDERGR